MDRCVSYAVKGENKESFMKAYLVLDFAISDFAGFKPYIAKIPAHIARHGGRYIVQGTPPTPIEGDWRPERMVILEFPARTNAEAFSRRSGYPGAVSDPSQHDHQPAGAGRRL